MRLIVIREVKGDDWDLNELMTIIEGEIEARERALNSTRDIPTAATLVSSDSNVPSVPIANGHILPVLVR